MAETPLYDQMSALLTYANGVTGAGDTHLGDAVRSLADGYGGGGGLPTGFTAIASGVYTLGTAVVGTATFTVDHNLGYVPDLFIFYAPQNIAQASTTLMAMRTKWWYRASSYVNWSVYHNASNTTTCTMANNTSSTVIKTLTATSATITNPSSTYTWRAGTYSWIAIKFGG